MSLLDTELAEETSNDLVVQRVSAATGNVAKFFCGTQEIIVTGTADGVLTGDINTINKGSTLSFTTNASGRQANTVLGDTLYTESLPPRACTRRASRRPP